MELLCVFFSIFFPCVRFYDEMLFDSCGGWSVIKEISTKGWSMVNGVIMRVFLDFFSLACDNLTSCDVILSVRWSKLKEVPTRRWSMLKKVVAWFNNSSIFIKFPELPLFFHQFPLLLLSFFNSLSLSRIWIRVSIFLCHFSPSSKSSVFSSSSMSSHMASSSSTSVFYSSKPCEGSFNFYYLPFNPYYSKIFF